MKTTVVGSYPVPERLRDESTPEVLEETLRGVLRLQEDSGVEVISDGELSRWDLRRRCVGGMVERFAHLMDGVEAEPDDRQIEAHRARPGMAYRPEPPGVVVGPLGRGRMDLAAEWETVRRLARRPLKFTVTSPYMIGKLLLDEHYGDFAQVVHAAAELLASEVARVEAAVVQVDEPNLPGTPEDWALAADAIGRVLRDARGEKAVHLCFGNFRGKAIQKGHYAQLVRFMNALPCDHLVLETTRRPQDELSALRDVDTRIGLGVGVVDVKEPLVETAETVASRIERLAGLVGVERLRYVHPDCGLQALPQAVADGKLRALVQGRDLFAGENTSGA